MWGVLKGPVVLKGYYIYLLIVGCSRGGLEIDGVLHNSTMITSTTEAVTITVRGSSSCTLRILTVGGGGSE